MRQTLLKTRSLREKAQSQKKRNIKGIHIFYYHRWWTTFLCRFLIFRLLQRHFLSAKKGVWIICPPTVQTIWTVFGADTLVYCWSRIWCKFVKQSNDFYSPRGCVRHFVKDRIMHLVWFGMHLAYAQTRVCLWGYRLPLELRPVISGHGVAQKNIFCNRKPSSYHRKK